MGRPRKTPLNGDSKLIFEAVVDLRKTLTTCQGVLHEISTGLATEVATRDAQHESNTRVLENMGGDVHIVLNKVQNLPCGAEMKRIDANEKDITFLRNFTVGGVLLLIVGAAVKIWLL